MAEANAAQRLPAQAPSQLGPECLPVILEDTRLFPRFC